VQQQQQQKRQRHQKQLDDAEQAAARSHSRQSNDTAPGKGKALLHLLHVLKCD
jgi:hypothetical protein